MEVNQDVSNCVTNMDGVIEMDEDDDFTEYLRDADLENIEHEVQCEKNVEADEDGGIPFSNIINRIIENVTKSQDKDAQEMDKREACSEEEEETASEDQEEYYVEALTYIEIMELFSDASLVEESVECCIWLS